MKISYLSGILGVVLCFSCRNELNTEQFSPYEHESMYFADLLQTEYQRIMSAKRSNVPQDSLQGLVKNVHRFLSKKHPILYDWWLQDGNDVNWYDSEDLNDELDSRLLMHDTLNLRSFDEKMALYIQLCIKRREKRLAGFIHKSPRIVFTKFHPLRPSFFAYTEGVSDARDEWNFIPNSEIGVLHMDGIWGEEETLLKDSLGVFRDPDVHFDGKHILFSWKKSAKEDDFHIYEMDYSTKEVKQLTHGLGYADIEPIYLPDENVLFNSTRSGNAVDCWKVEVSNLYLCDREGRFIRRVGYDQVHTPHPVLLDDGRVVYTRWEYNDRGQVYTQPLFQMNPDGTGQAEYYGLNSFFPTTLTHAAPIPNSRTLMAIATGHHTPQHGKLCVIDIEAGRNEEQGVTMIAPIRKPEPVRVDRYGMHGDQFQYPHPISEEQFLVSYTPLGYHVGDPMLFGIYWMNHDGERELLLADSTISCNQPILLEERDRPFQRASHVDYTKKEGLYYMQNIYAGDAMEGVAIGDVKKLRVVEIEYRVASVGTAFGEGKGGAGHAFSPVGVGNASWDLKRVHGTVDVYADGSALFQVPALTPLYFQALDSNNRVIQTMRSWSTLQPGEMQSCVGCHEHKNSVPLSDHPVSMAMRNGVQRLQQEHSGNRVFSYQKEVQPIWDKHCVDCHHGKDGRLDLRGDLSVVDNQTKRKFSASYLQLTHARKTTWWNDSWQGDDRNPEVNWISALSEPSLLPPYSAGANTSELIKRLERGHRGIKLSKKEIELVSLWIDLGVPFIADYKEAGVWTEKEHEYYDYYWNKREKAREEEKQAMIAYIEYLKNKK